MKSKLFIIGNGFDIGHGIKSSYLDFKHWLALNYPDSTQTELFSLADYVIAPDGEEYIGDEDLAAFLVYCMEMTTGGDWSDFENALGEIDWESFFDELSDVLDNDGDIDFFKTAYNREDFTTTLSINSTAFSRLFSMWINSLEYPCDIARNNFLSPPTINNSIFLTFNYTCTLEELYHVPVENVCHIHGKQGGPLIIGHDKPDIYNLDDNMEPTLDFGMEGISDIHHSLRKPTEKIYKQTQFFKNLCTETQQISDIFSWGFSFSKVDLFYIEKLCQIIDTTGITWHLHDFDPSKISSYTQALVSCGFQGKICTFHA